jgi:hypothetical protein
MLSCEWIGEYYGCCDASILNVVSDDISKLPAHIVKKG